MRLLNGTLWVMSGSVLKLEVNDCWGSLWAQGSVHAMNHREAPERVDCAPPLDFVFATAPQR